VEEDNDSLWEPAECGDKVTGSTGRSLGSDPCRARDFSVPRSIRTDFMAPPFLPFRGDRLLYPLAYSGRGVKLASHFIRILSTCGSAIMACVGTAFFFYKEIYCTKSTYSVYKDKLGTAVAQWLRCCVTNRKVAGSIPVVSLEFLI